jgi:vacuolar-type H+-ATPase subunit C/Vma6
MVERYWMVPTLNIGMKQGAMGEGQRTCDGWLYKKFGSWLRLLLALEKCFYKNALHLRRQYEVTNTAIEYIRDGIDNVLITIVSKVIKNQTIFISFLRLPDFCSSNTPPKGSQTDFSDIL